jgi:drug/metabolite transporter (DMT)-like permease
MGILFGLTAAICWGVADFVVTRIARELGVAQAFFYVQVIGLGLIGLLLLASPAMPAPTAGMWLLVLGIGLFNLAGTLLLYRAFAIGTLALVSPIASAFGVVSALLALLAGERPAMLARHGGAGAGCRSAGYAGVCGVQPWDRQRLHVDRYGAGIALQRCHRAAGLGDPA